MERCTLDRRLRHPLCALLTLDLADGKGRHHPSDQPRRAEASVIVFSLQDTESIDASALQLISEVVAAYAARSVLVRLINCPSDQFKSKLTVKTCADLLGARPAGGAGASREGWGAGALRRWYERCRVLFQTLTESSFDRIPRAAERPVRSERVERDSFRIFILSSSPRCQ